MLRDEFIPFCFADNLQVISVKEDVVIGQLSPSTETYIFDLSLENPLPLIIISWPLYAPEFGEISVMAGKTVC